MIRKVLVCEYVGECRTLGLWVRMMLELWVRMMHV